MASAIGIEGHSSSREPSRATRVKLDGAAIGDALLIEAAALLEEARRERDSARQEAADLREALREAQAPSAADLLSRIEHGSYGRADRFVVMAQNPANNHHWSKAIGNFTCGEVRDALAKASAQ